MSAPPFMPGIRTTIRGLYAGSYDVTLRPWEGMDTSRTCYLFSGQGASSPSMFLAPYERGGIVRQYFDRADELAVRIGAPAPSSYFLAPPGDDAAAARTLALFTLQAGLFNELLKEGPQPRMVSGFSAGEFAAVVCAGVASFDDIFEILAFREHVSSPANALGFMVAVGAGELTFGREWARTSTIALPT